MVLTLKQKKHIQKSIKKAAGRGNPYPAYFFALFCYRCAILKRFGPFSNRRSRGIMAHLHQNTPEGTESKHMKIQKYHSVSYKSLQ